MFLREPSHWIILAVVVLVLFGGKRLPDAARGIGRSLRIFKSEIKEMNKDDETPKDHADRAGNPERVEPIEGRIVGRSDQNGQTPAQTPAGEPRRDV
jgi:sec-independent protein translocase protein TatA